MSTSQLQAHAVLLRLPRELRDMIYPHIVTKDSPICISHPAPHPITDPSMSHPTVAAEALESFYTHNTFILTFSPHIMPLPSMCWGPNPALEQSKIRYLILKADEPLQPFHQSAKPVLSTDFESNPQFFRSADRQMWSELFNVAKLESLEVRMQKYYDDTFSWMAFAPILYELRARNPHLEFTFTISFDKMLEKFWDDPAWRWFEARQQWPLHWLMGYVNVTDFFVEPGEEDRNYVAEYLPAKIMPIGRSVKDGLLDATPRQREAYGATYVVKEPHLLRVLMWEHWWIWRVAEAWRENQEERGSMVGHNLYV